MRDLKISLITKYKANSKSTSISTQTTDVWASKKSVGRLEFYEAYTSNLKPKNIFDILPSEFKRAIVTNSDGNVFEPTRLKVGNDEFDIIRVFTKNDYSMEITAG